jgi:type I restriction enzyme S subunit
MTEQKQVIPEGYKQTEIGVLPEDWISGSLGDNTINIGSGRTSTKGSGDYPLFGSTGVIGSCLNGEYEGDAILVARVGANAGKINFVTGKYGVSDNTIIVKFKNSVDIAYFRYQLDRKNLNTLVFGSGQPLITGSQLKEILFPLPPKYEQTAIANALSDVDALISELEKFIAKKQAIKTATMQQLLTGKTRLPPFSLREDGTPKGYKASELGEIPEDWDVRSVYDLAENQKSLFDDGDWIEAEHITDKGIRLIQTGNIGIGVYVEKEAKKYIYESSFEKLKCKELRIGDLLICRLAEPAGRACIMPSIGEEKVITSVDVTIFRPINELADRRFLLQYFSSIEWFKSVQEQVGGTTHKRITRGALGKILIIYPSMKEQTAIAAILSDMDVEIQTLQQRLNKTRQIKQGMMQELLTGKTRLI